mmetsp:Transcript_37459/g.81914  ORF Transcript_37459/g.81914 Transcript_37459/m.81914 type:complete len:214 (-) Transcript_37459:319-960(-)
MNRDRRVQPAASSPASRSCAGLFREGAGEIRDGPVLHSSQLRYAFKPSRSHRSARLHRHTDGPGFCVGLGFVPRSRCSAGTARIAGRSWGVLCAMSIHPVHHGGVNSVRIFADRSSRGLVTTFLPTLAREHTSTSADVMPIHCGELRADGLLGEVVHAPLASCQLRGGGVVLVVHPGLRLSRQGLIPDVVKGGKVVQRGKILGVGGGGGQPVE